MKIEFLGAVGTVTGSKFLVSSGSSRLMVDSGLFQGVKALRLRNWNPLPINPEMIDAVVLTHAHIDHSGYLPVLVRNGFKGPIFCTPPTGEICEILLKDSAKLQVEAAAYANKKGFSRHKPARPLYDDKDAKQASSRLRHLPFGKEVSVGDLEVKFVPAGHILGASSVLVESKGKSILFSGDIGRPDDPLMFTPDPSTRPDWVVMESTYGGRLHKPGDPMEAIGDVLRKTIGRGGVLLIPSFAVGRAQTILHCLHTLMAAGKAPHAEIYMNSPMANNVTALYERYAKYHRLTKEETHVMCGSANFVRSVEESKALNRKRGPMVVISASGMLTGGRILHHLKAFAPDPKNTILLPGYQAPGTRGGLLVGGAKRIKIHGRYVEVGAEVVQLDMFSAHADQGELIQWVESIGHRPKEVFLVHGEPAACDTLRLRLQEDLKLSVQCPEDRQVVEMT